MVILFLSVVLCVLALLGFKVKSLKFSVVMLCVGLVLMAFSLGLFRL
jgi:hypothetical protein